MPKDLLVAQGPSITGQWVRTEPPFRTLKYRIEITGSFAADNVIIEELIGGLPTSPGPLPGNPGLLTAGSQTGTVATVATVGAPQDIIIDAPMEFLRARTGAAMTGTASVRLVEAQ